jgi:hypothetical protein
MTRIFAVLLPLLVAGCIGSGSVSGPPADSIFNTGPLSGKYPGADAGYLVVTIAAQTDTLYDDYWIYFRRKDRSADNQIWWGQQNPVDQRKLDIKNDKEEGMVDVRRLPPGDYEIFNFQVHRNAGYLQTWWGSKQDFSIPFSIIAGRATYVGELMAVGLKGEKGFLGARSPLGAYFVLTDKSDRDVPIAKQKEPGIGEVVSAVIDPAALANPMITRRGAP